MSEKEGKTLLTYKLSPLQDAIINYLVPSVASCILFAFTFASDIALIYRHFKDDHHTWAYLIIWLMYLPVAGSLVLIVTDWDLWPKDEEVKHRMTRCLWLFGKLIEHIFFPVWMMWRYAERIFWSIEAIVAPDEIKRKEAKAYVYAPRNIELYVFLQAYLYALPQVMLQLYILMRHEKTVDKETYDAQIISVALNLAKVSITTTYYQRFKTQKLAGLQYPWHKQYRKNTQSKAVEVILRRSISNYSKKLGSERSSISKRLSSTMSRLNVNTNRLSLRRSSSDIYMVPNPVTNELEPLEGRDEVDLTQNDQPEVDQLINEQRRSEINERISSLFSKRQTGFSDRPEADFNIRRSKTIEVKGLPEDDLAGKLIAFCWWFSFLLARVLAISAFFYFFPQPTIYLLLSHFVLVITLLLYDVKQDNIRRSKIIFFLFIGYVYIFCIIEFKIKFKKAWFIYYGFFALVFTENIIMCSIWFTNELDSLNNDFWFRFIFIIIVMCSLVSFSAMLFYYFVNQPKKVIVKRETIIS